MTQGGGSTPERLLATAAALFRKKGYAATTTREIAAAVGIQQASLYYHAKSKDELLYHVFVSSLDRLQTEAEAATAREEDPLQRVRVFIRTHVALLLKFQDSNVTMITELRALSGQYRSDVIARRRRYATLVRTVLEQAQAAGFMRHDIPARYLYLALLNLLNWSTLWFQAGKALTPGKLADLFTILFLEGAAAPSRRSSLCQERKQAGEAVAVRRRSKEKRSGETLRRILVAAAGLFAKKGYSMTSMREIAEAVTIQKASLYYHVNTKEDLLFSICESSLLRMTHAADTALQQAQDPLERIRRFILTHVESVLQDQDLHAAALAEMRYLSKPRLRRVVASRECYEDLLRSVLHDAQAAGILRDDVDTKYMALGLLGMMNRVEMWFRPSGPLSGQQLGALFAEVFLVGAAR